MLSKKGNPEHNYKVAKTPSSHLDETYKKVEEYYSEKNRDEETREMLEVFYTGNGTFLINPDGSVQYYDVE